MLNSPQCIMLCCTTSHQGLRWRGLIDCEGGSDAAGPMQVWCQSGKYPPTRVPLPAVLSKYRKTSCHSFRPPRAASSAQTPAVINAHRYSQAGQLANKAQLPATMKLSVVLLCIAACVLFISTASAWGGHWGHGCGRSEPRACQAVLVMRDRACLAASPLVAFMQAHTNGTCWFKTGL